MITILMAAYNGEEYIGEQIKSILNQTYQDWKLIIQDDRSTDDTFRIASDYSQMYPGKITAVRRSVNSGSAASNFFSMLAYANGEYIMFSDDDDVWLPNKIKLTLEKMEEFEKTNGYEKPLLVHTDLEVVDHSLNRVAASFLAMQKLDSRRSSLNCLLVQNIVTGCTTMVNKKMIEMIGTPPAYAVMHDWWMALVAAAFGGIAFVETPTVLYRQHEKNAVGAKRVTDIKYNINRLFDFKQARIEIKKTYLQAKAFAEAYNQKLCFDKKQMIEHLALLSTETAIRRFRILRKYSLWKNGVLRRLAQIFI